MQAALFLKHKLERQVCQNGREFVFVKYKTDKYKQLSSEIEAEVKVRGIFHTTNSYIKKSETEGARLITKPQPMILMLYESGAKITKDDKVKIGDNLYQVIEKNDINNLGVAFDVSLDLVYE